MLNQVWNVSDDHFEGQFEGAVMIGFRKGAPLRISACANVHSPRGILPWMIAPQLAHGRK